MGTGSSGPRAPAGPTPLTTLTLPNDAKPAHPGEPMPRTARRRAMTHSTPTTPAAPAPAVPGRVPPLGGARRSPRLRLALPLAAVVVLLPLAGCSGGGSESTDSSAAAVGAPEAAVAVPPDGAIQEGVVQDGAMSSLTYEDSTRVGDVDQAAGSTAGDPAAGVRAPAIIRTGTVSLRADDVDLARFDVQKIVDGAGGEVGEDRTKADEDGGARFSRSVVRVPVAVFDETMQALETLDSATRLGATTAAQDVTTEVIDTDVRVALQRRSIARISALLDRAASIRDIVSLENELARREADLGSLEQQQDYLSDQTSMATITIAIERTDPDAPAPEEDRDGFVGGLDRGWDAFTDAAEAGLTGLGLALPFAAVGAAAAGGLVIARRRRGRTVPGGA